jgi:hypothetical protein
MWSLLKIRYCMCAKMLWYEPIFRTDRYMCFREKISFANEYSTATYNDVMTQDMCTTKCSARVTVCAWCNFPVAIVCQRYDILYDVIYLLTATHTHTHTLQNYKTTTVQIKTNNGKHEVQGQACCSPWNVLLAPTTVARLRYATVSCVGTQGQDGRCTELMQ